MKTVKMFVYRGLDVESERTNSLLYMCACLFSLIYINNLLKIIQFFFFFVLDAVVKKVDDAKEDKFNWWKIYNMHFE